MLVTHSLQPSDDPIAAKHNHSGSHWTNNYPVTSKRLHNKCILDGLSVDSHDQRCKNDELLSTSNSGKLMLQLIDSSMMFEDKLPSVLFQSMLHVFVGTLFVLQIKRFPQGSPPQGKKWINVFTWSTQYTNKPEYTTGCVAPKPAETKFNYNRPPRTPTPSTANIQIKPQTQRQTQAQTQIQAQTQAQTQA